MSERYSRMFGPAALCLLAGLLLLTGCPKKPSQTTTPIEQVKPPVTGTQPGAEAPGIETPSVQEEELAGVGKPIAALKPIYFDYDKSDIRDDMKPVLEENARWLLANASVKAQVEGHCDERGTNDYNLALGSRRAESVKRHLIALGVPASRLSTISYGEERPVCSQSDETCYSRNRRAQFAEAAKAG
ncbi:MAG: peptidoglycan-associated lipoprotein Pal [Nitrospirota bacterium]